MDENFNERIATLNYSEEETGQFEISRWFFPLKMIKYDAYNKLQIWIIKVNRDR